MVGGRRSRPATRAAEAGRAVAGLRGAARAGAARGGRAAEALALLPGEGDVGAALVKDPRVHTIAFTGSRQVGLEIVRAAAEVARGQRHLKRVIAEMGGKNCVLVDSDADLDEVVPALVASAFVFAGQKCSAAARVLCHEAIHDALVERLAGAVETLQVGQAERLDTDVPPGHRARGAGAGAALRGGGAQKSGRIAARAHDVAGRRLVRHADARRRPADGLAVLTEEIFGPLLAVERVRDLDRRLRPPRRLPFALTGGLFARNPDTSTTSSRARRSATSTSTAPSPARWSARQPFGGNRLRAPARRPADRATCCSSSSRAW